MEYKKAREDAIADSTCPSPAGRRIAKKFDKRNWLKQENLQTTARYSPVRVQGACYRVFLSCFIS